MVKRIPPIEVILAVLGIALASFLLFYNRGLNPRPWQDEGSMLSLAKTLAQDGVYSVRSSDGYQTFGAVQSVGPTLIVPTAQVFKTFGIGLAQARAVTGAYALLALITLYLSGRALFGRLAGLIACAFVVSSTYLLFLMWSRQLLGEVPATFFFLAAWLAWRTGLDQRKFIYHIGAGLLLGAAMVTKSQFILMGLAAVAITAVLNLAYFKQRALASLIVIGGIAAACTAAWQAWQYWYFGAETFARNADTLRQLAAATGGLRLNIIADSVRSLLGAGSGRVFVFWCVPALVLGAVLATRRTRDGLTLSFLISFAVLFIAYNVVWTLLWAANLIAPFAVCALVLGHFVAKLAHSAFATRQHWRDDIAAWRAGAPSPKTLQRLAAAMLLFIFTTWLLDELQTVARTDVLDKVGPPSNVENFPRMPLAPPHEMAAYLNANVPQDQGVVVETWERELFLLSQHNFHFPDQANLVHGQNARYSGVTAEKRAYALAADYFGKTRPQYVVVGWVARFYKIYDMDYIAQHSTLIATIGEGERRYEVYKANTNAW
jgi:4-amino-4-deoxy-L-arabinose transferase-like glycosyltransferase